MENDWRMHPLLSLQIYLTERAGKRGGCVWGWVDGWMEGAGRKGGVGVFARCREGREPVRDWELQRCLSSRPSRLTRGAAPAESCA